MVADESQRGAMLAVLHEYFERAWGLGDEAAARRLLDPDVTFLGTFPLRGREAVLEYIRAMHRGFPGLTIAVQEEVVEGAVAAVRFTIRGTQTGPYLGIEPANRPITISGTGIFHVRGGLICEVFLSIDAFGYLLQAGAIPPLARLE